MTPTWKKQRRGPAELICWWQDGVPAWQRAEKGWGFTSRHSPGRCPWKKACAPCDSKGLLVTPRAPSWLSISNQDELLLAWAGSTGGVLPDGVETASGQLRLFLLNCL